MKDPLYPPQGFDPNQVFDLKFYKFAFFPPQGGEGMGGAVPSVVKELFEDPVADFDNVIFDDGVETGDVLVIQ